MNKLNNISAAPSLRFPGYIKEWKKEQLGDIAYFYKGRGISKEDIIENGKNKCIRYGELYTYYHEKIIKTKSRTNVPQSSSLSSIANDLLIPSSGETAIDISTVSCVTENDILLGGDLNVIRLKANNDGVYFAYYLSHFCKVQIAKLAQGNSVVHLYPSHLKRLNIKTPSYLEQQKISSFLSTTDSWLENLRSQKLSLESYKKSIMQKIFSQEIRFKDSKGQDYPKWTVKVIGAVITEYFDKSEVNNQFPVLTSSRKGLIPQNEYYGQVNRVTDRENTGFNVIPRNYLTYRSRSDDGVFHFNQNTTGRNGVVSTYYPVFMMKDGNNKFLLEYLNINWRKLTKYSVGTSQKVLAMNELKKLKLLFPLLEEQEMIADYFTSIDKSIESIQKQITQVELWKKGLMHRMFI